MSGDNQQQQQQGSGGVLAPPPADSPLSGVLAPPRVPEFLTDKREMVDHPNHYGGDTPYETIKVLEAWMHPEAFLGALRFNSIKYLSRAGRKGEVSQDLEKARWYIDYEIKTRAKLGEKA